LFFPPPPAGCRGRIKQSRDIGMFASATPHRDRARGLVASRNAKGQRLQAFQQHKGVNVRIEGPGLAHEVMECARR